MRSVRRIVHFSGRVQGVGLSCDDPLHRRSFRVGGYVKNLADGRVELDAEGEPAEVARFIDSVKDRMQRNIVEATTDSRQPQGDDSFRTEH